MQYILNVFAHYIYFIKKKYSDIFTLATHQIFLMQKNAIQIIWCSYTFYKPYRIVGQL